jgi:hypothetical protein
VVIDGNVSRRPIQEGPRITDLVQVPPFSEPDECLLDHILSFRTRVAERAVNESEQFLVVFPVEGRKEFSAAPADSGSFSDG